MMRPSHALNASRTAAAMTIAVALLAPRPAIADETLEIVLQRAATYASEFRRQLSSVVAEETYEQRVRSTMGVDIAVDGRGTPPVMHRELKSDILMVRTSDRYVEFRDVFEVDGAPIRDREARLATLFLSKSATAGDQIFRIAEESARYNIGSIYRNINTPTLPLMFLEPDQQARFRFRRAKAASPTLASGWLQSASTVFAAPDRAWVVEYQEVQKQTIIRRMNGAGDMPARGRFWIDPATGRVLLTEMTVGDPLMQCTIAVAYAVSPSLGDMWVPVEMRERYTNRQDRVTTTGTAKYGRVRRFGVQTNEIIPQVR